MQHIKITVNLGEFHRFIDSDNKTGLMILTLVNNIRQLLVLTHATNIGIADRTLPPPKEVGF